MTELDTLLTQSIENGELDRKTELELVAKLLGYKRMPVDIETFIEDPYYLGNVFGGGQLYPMWKKKLKEVFPDPIHISKMIVVLTGAIGTGKSTFSRICSLYLQHKLDCLEDPYKTLGIARGKSLNFVFFHTTATKAQTDFVDPNNNNKKDSPYFKEGMLHKDIPLLDVVDGAKSNASIGGDTVFEVLSELNFVKRTTADYKLDQAVKRIQSRFLKVVGYFILIIIDTSARGDDTITDDFIKSNPFTDQVKVIRASIWDAKAHLNIYGRKGWFDVYIGDSQHPPFIIKDLEKDVTVEMDKTRVIKVPEELRASFEFNIIAGLQDQAGVSTKSTGKLFEDPTPVREQFKLPMYSNDVLTVDFFNKSDKLIYQLDRYLRDIPTDRVIFPRYDLGVTGDHTGLAVTYFDKYIYFDKEGRVKMPTYKTPLMVGISRVKGQETSLYHLYEFILDLKDRFQIGEFTADQFASRQMLQDLEREGLQTRLLSVDRTDTPYIYFKNMVLNKLWEGARNELAVKEVCELNWLDEKVDHPATGCFTGDTEIITSEGLVPISELLNKSNCKVLSYNTESQEFEFCDFINARCTGYKDEVLELVDDGGMTIRCTDDHRFLTTNGYIQAKDLSEDDEIVSLVSRGENPPYSNGFQRITKIVTLSLNNIHALQKIPTSTSVGARFSVPRDLTPQSRIVSKFTVSYDTQIPVYDIEVPKNHNFVLSNGMVVHNSKDIMDAVCGSVYSCFENLEVAEKLSVKYQMESHNQWLQGRLTDHNDAFQGMLSNIYG